jgi:hypothetical protein
MILNQYNEPLLAISVDHFVHFTFWNYFGHCLAWLILENKILKITKQISVKHSQAIRHVIVYFY